MLKRIESEPEVEEKMGRGLQPSRATTPAVFTENAGAAELSDSCAAVSCLPTTAVLELTAACNRKCLFCSCPWEAAAVSGFESRGELSVANWKEVITMLRVRVTGVLCDGGCREAAHVCGGAVDAPDPLLALEIKNTGQK
jgi:hypothetical protein